MFSKNHMSIGDWWLFFIFMIIPIVNVLLLLVILLSSGTNKTLKNFIIAIFLPSIILFLLFFSAGFVSAF